MKRDHRTPALDLQSEPPILDKLGFEDAVVRCNEGQLLNKGFAGEWRHHDLHGAGELVTKPLKYLCLLNIKIIKMTRW